ncbi:MAG TPA: cytochrome c3 family protein [Pyrinomonadaceae bacterium]|nr:cytochrome c3 family protein [Pyrinomonadaceae bacterium]
MKQQKQHKKALKPNSLRLRELVVLIGFCLMIGYFAVSCTSTVQEKKAPEDPFKPLDPEQVFSDMTNLDFKTFKHTEGRHSTVPCLLCHQRNEESPKPRFASHQICAGCHAQQFKDQRHDICSICHSNVETGEVKKFPSLTTFKMEFNHSAHLKLTNCATCHKTAGANMAIPSGVNAHETCFQCHTSDKMVGEKSIGSCSTCHEPGKPNRISAEFTNVGFNFSHTRHGKLNCQECHGSSGNAMSKINVGMHSGANNNCATCHNGQRAFGATNFSDCRKCHTEVQSAAFGIKFSHDVHSKTNCATCHKQGGSGATFTIPNTQTAHNTCFQCHSPMKGGGSFTDGKCFTCHQSGSKNNIAPPPQTIGGNFNHKKHSGFDCDSCHTSQKGQMSAPTVAMHRQVKSGFSCVNCHNNEVAFGENFANCKRCHTNSKFGSK